MEQQNQQPQPPVFIQPPSQQFQPRVTASPMMDPVTAVTTCFKKYFDFKGRARRSEFWWFALFVIICTSALTFLKYRCAPPQKCARPKFSKITNF